MSKKNNENDKLMSGFYKIDVINIKNSVNNVLEMKDEIFIILERKTKEVQIVNTGKDLMDIFINDKFLQLPEYKLFEIFKFCNAIIKESAKYRTLNWSKNKKYTIFKVNIFNTLIEKHKDTPESDLPSYLYEYNDIKKHPVVQKYFRKEKINRLL